MGALDKFTDELFETLKDGGDHADHLLHKDKDKKADDAPRSKDTDEEVVRKLMVKYGFPMVATSFFGQIAKAYRTEIVDSVPEDAVKIEKSPDLLAIEMRRDDGQK